MRQPLAMIVVVVVVVAGLVGCTSTSLPPAESTPPISPGVPSPASASETSVLGCGSSVYGNLGKDWRERAVTVGPIAFVNLPLFPTAPPQWFQPKASYEDAAFEKVLIVVRKGHEVTVTIPPRYRHDLALAYDVGSAARLISSGESSVTFRSCSAGQSQFGDHPGTQFAGGFLVTGPMCASMTVMPQGRAVSHLPLSFGTGQDCPA